MSNNYINLMDKQQVSQVIQGQLNGAIGVVDQYVIKKTNDLNEVSLADLKTNNNVAIFTQTPNNQWLLFEFMRKEKISVIKGQLYNQDQNNISVECQYLNQKKQWIHQFNYNFQLNIEQRINPPFTAYGIRFRNTNSTDLKFINLNIIVKRGRPYVKQENPWRNAQLIHNKYEIVNLMNFQTFYKKIDDSLVTYKKPVVTKTFDASHYDNEEITDNVDQDIYQQCSSPSQWLTYEFDRKYKLSKIEIQLYKKDRRKYDYQIEVMNKRKNWIQVDAGRSGNKPIEVAFLNFYPCCGIRIKGKATVTTSHGITVVQMKIFAQRGNPIIIQS